MTPPAARPPPPSAAACRWPAAGPHHRTNVADNTSRLKCRDKVDGPAWPSNCIDEPVGRISGGPMRVSDRDVTPSADVRDASNPRVFGPHAEWLQLAVNGRGHRIRADPATTLAEVLRDELELTGTKIGCDRGACSACTVWLDGEVASSCMTLAFDARGRRDHDDRRARADGDAASGAAGLHRARRDAVRLLHAGHGHELRGAGRAQPRLHAGRREGGGQRAPVPVRHVSRTSSRRRWPRAAASRSSAIKGRERRDPETADRRGRRPSRRSRRPRQSARPGPRRSSRRLRHRRRSHCSR